MKRKKNGDKADRGRNTGTIMVELNIFFLVLLLGCGLLFNYQHMLLRNCIRVLSDIELFRTARYSQAILKRELSYHAAAIRLGKDLNGRDQLVCQKILHNVRTQWYVLNGILYRKTVKGTDSGINPFSDPRIEITGFSAEKLTEDRLKLSIVFTEPRLGISRSFPFIFYLSNAVIDG